METSQAAPAQRSWRREAGLEQLEGVLPAAEGDLGDAGDDVGEGDEVGFGEAVGDLAGLLDEGGAARDGVAGAAGDHHHADEGEAAGDAARLAGLQGEQEAAQGEAVAADGVDEGEALAGGQAHVGAQQLGGGDVGLGGAAEVDAAQAQLGRSGDDRHVGAAGGRRVREADLAEHGAQELDALVDAAADEELLAGAAAQLDGERRGLAGGGLEVERGRLAAATGEHQDVGAQAQEVRGGRGCRVSVPAGRSRRGRGGRARRRG
jgi:hypothetical protein